jgi:Domain of unknown function (DUF1905)
MEFEFESVVFEWRGPSPFYFVAVPDDVAAEIKLIAPTLTYGWGVIPATVTIGSTTVTSSLFPKDGGYLVPLKDSLRKPEGVSDGVSVAIDLSLG